MLAFRNALAAGYHVFEIDVHGTRDGDLVVIHDLTVDRTSDGRGAVHELLTADLGRMRLHGTDGETIPHLDAILELFREHGATSIVEIKFRSDRPEHDGLCRRLAEALERWDMLRSTTVSAFSWQSLTMLNRLSPTINLTAVASAQGIATCGGIDATVAAAAELGARDLALEWTAVGPTTAAAAHARGMRLGVWTPNATADMAHVAACGVDWIITDRPDLAPAATTTS